jgi:hypothetical protein
MFHGPGARLRLDAARAAKIAQFCSGNMIFAVGVEERERRKAFDQEGIFGGNVTVLAMSR